MQRIKLILKKLIPAPLLKPFLPTYHWLLAYGANLRYGFPARKLNVIGITGTNGKTTTAALIASVLEAAGYSVGVSTTALFKVGDQAWENDLNMTVTDSFVLQKLLKKMSIAKVDWVVLEVTSHALDQNRVWGIPIQTAVITNLTPDHLDYHPSMEAYAHAKAKLLKRAKKAVVLNHDDDWFSYFNQISSQEKFMYGVDTEADVRLLKAKLTPTSSKLQIRYGRQPIDVNLRLSGKFNVYNALAAAAVALSLGINADTLTRGLESLELVPGRLEHINAGQEFTVMVDYAHGPDAFTQLFTAMRPLTKGKLIAVFGGGYQDQHRWSGLGSAAGALTDVAIVTDDEPGDIDPAHIRATIIDAAQEPGAAEIIEQADRAAAMRRAFAMAKPDDTVLLLCLGHQKFRRMEEGKEPWDDRQVATQILEEMALEQAAKKLKKKTKS